MAHFQIHLPYSLSLYLFLSRLLSLVLPLLCMCVADCVELMSQIRGKTRWTSSIVVQRNECFSHDVCGDCLLRRRLYLNSCILTPIWVGNLITLSTRLNMVNELIFDSKCQPRKILELAESFSNDRSPTKRRESSIKSFIIENDYSGQTKNAWIDSKNLHWIITIYKWQWFSIIRATVNKT